MLQTEAYFTIVNYNRKTFTVQAAGVKSLLYLLIVSDLFLLF
jgi:hypothetical protein